MIQHIWTRTAVLCNWKSLECWRKLCPLLLFGVIAPSSRNAMLMFCCWQQRGILPITRCGILAIIMAQSSLLSKSLRGGGIFHLIVFVGARQVALHQTFVLLHFMWGKAFHASDAGIGAGTVYLSGRDLGRSPTGCLSGCPSTSDCESVRLSKGPSK